jgi:hypothetical protein
MAQLCPQTPGSLFVAFYDSRGGILAHLHIGRIELCLPKIGSDSQDTFSLGITNLGLLKYGELTEGKIQEKVPESDR